MDQKQTEHSTVIIHKIFSANSGFATRWHYMPSSSGKFRKSNMNGSTSSVSKKSGIHHIQQIPGGILKLQLCYRVAPYA